MTKQTQEHSLSIKTPIYNMKKSEPTILNSFKYKLDQQQLFVKDFPVFNTPILTTPSSPSKPLLNSFY